MSSFEVKYGNGETYKRYAALEPKFTQEFRNVTKELMVETYIRDQMGSKTMPDRNYQNLKNLWKYIAEELGVLKDYPYDMNTYAPAHPLAKEVAVEGKRVLGIAV